MDRSTAELSTLTSGGRILARLRSTIENGGAGGGNGIAELDVCVAVAATDGDAAVVPGPGATEAPDFAALPSPSAKPPSGLVKLAGPSDRRRL
jgi:hypothetical protein